MGDTFITPDWDTYTYEYKVEYGVDMAPEGWDSKDVARIFGVPFHMVADTVAEIQDEIDARVMCAPPAPQATHRRAISLGGVL
jgi:hypothetical protein